MQRDNWLGLGVYN